ncbi:MAG: protoporphyrinogen oxidase [Bacteroidales bacterium]
MSDNKIYSAVVIGAGLTGLTAAYHLRKKDILVLEENPEAGGVIHTQRNDGFLYESGPNTGVVGTPEIVELFEELKGKCELEEANENNKKRYILKDGNWQPLPGSLKGGIQTPLFTLGDKIRLLGEPFRSKGKDPHETLSALVKRRMGQSFLDYAIDPFILGVYAGDPDVLVPKYALPKLYNLEQDYGSFIGGAIKKQMEKKTDQEKKVTRKVFSVKGGLSNLVIALFKSVGEDKFVFEAKGVEVLPQDDLFLINYHKNGKTFNVRTRNVISTTGAHQLPSVMPFIDKKDIGVLTGLHYARVVEVSLGFKEWEGMPLDAFGGLIPSRENRDILGILFLSALFSDRAPANGALLTVFIGGSRKEHLVNFTDDQIRNLVQKEVTDLMGLPSFHPSLFYINRYDHAIPQYDARSGKRFEVIRKLEALYPGLFLGGNMRDGIGMADRVKQGKNLAMNILDALS